MYNFTFVVLSCLVAHLIPLELMLGAYAFLGPAHYLTEISWLHDRKYFSHRVLVAIPMALGMVAVVFFPELWGPYIWCSLSLALSFSLFDSHVLRFATCVFFMTSYFVFHDYGPIPIILFSLLTTIIHVFLFTVLFVLNGYLKRRDTWAMGTLVAIVGATVSFFIFSEGAFNPLPGWTERNIRAFEGISYDIAELFGIVTSNSALQALSKFVAFAYTFHYLNWFSKTGSLGWHRTSKRRYAIVVSAYATFVGIYLYDYHLGLKVLFFLSVLHVVLEFPLNVLVARETLQLGVRAWLDSKKNASLSRPPDNIRKTG